MAGLLKRGALAILGMVVVLGYWTIKGHFTDSASASLSHIPDKVWGGGGGQMVVEAETSEPGRIYVSFETDKPIDSSEHKFLETWEKVDAGSHSFTIDVPAGVGGTVEIDAENPKVGSKVAITVKVGGSVVAEDSSVLNEPLHPGYGFFAQVELADYATGKLAED